ncbi:lymphocyte cytosolic protein 2-like isoform X3 [Pseudophryne corroboree]|uniref:lymphocyte cytosolic protein 2-like isoform X3 n=1 Tax=Pseudophryne corroboree TaxID=495146 RepID=UPI00308201E2
MDFRKVPSCTEVSSWGPDTLIDYFKMCNLKDCQKLIKKQGITGKRFLEMSENDMQKFPKITVPILIRIQQEINKKEEKRGLFPRPETQKGHLVGKLNYPHTQGTSNANTSESWDSDSDSFDDDDYEDPDEENDDGDYESPTPGDDNDDGNSDGDYEPPPSNIENCPINPPKTKLGDSDYADRPVPGNYTKGPPNPPTRPGFPIFPARGKTFPGAQSSSTQENHRIPKPQQQTTSPPIVHRASKPTLPLNTVKPVSGKFQPDLTKNSTVPARLRQNADAEDVLPDEEDGPHRVYPHRPYNSNTFPSASPKPTMKHISSGSNTMPITDTSHPGAPKPGGLLYNPYKPGAVRWVPSWILDQHERGSLPGIPGLLYLPEYRFSEGSGNSRPPAPIPVNSMPQHSNDSLSSEQWYLGNISRKDAENALRTINQDGTFLVRNCSQSTTSQPYVLMVLYRDKVYNVRIRYDQDNQAYILGSKGQEPFGSVSDIINFFRQTPLLLIDGKDRGSRQHCKLTSIAARSFH